MSSDLDKNYGLGKPVIKDKNKNTIDNVIKSEPKGLPTKPSSSQASKDYVKVPTIRKKI